MMVDSLSDYVKENCASAVKMTLGEWVVKNPLPAAAQQKVDGVRVFLFKSGGKCVLATKHNGLYTLESHDRKFAEMLTQVSQCIQPNRAILDAELVISEKKLYAFDILRWNEKDIGLLGWDFRMLMLRSAIKPCEAVEILPSRKLDSIEQIEDSFDQCTRLGWEGLVLKNPISKYGDANSWLKLKRHETEDVFVTGYEETAESKSTGVYRAWRIASYTKSGVMIPLGVIGSEKSNVDIRAIKPGTVLEIQFQEVTEAQKLRHAFILRIRTDKRPTPEDCKLQSPDLQERRGDEKWI